MKLKHLDYLSELFVDQYEFLDSNGNSRDGCTVGYNGNKIYLMGFHADLPLQNLIQICRELRKEYVESPIYAYRARIGRYRKVL